MRKPSPKIEQFILEEIQRNPGGNPSALIQEHFSISRETARSYFNRLIDRDRIRVEGSGKGTRYFPGKNFPAEEKWEFQLSQDELANRGEDEVFRNHIRPILISRVSQSVLDRCAYIATEILNNVIDHSNATSTDIVVYLSGRSLEMHFTDDGIGAFEKVRTYFNLRDVFEAVGEIAKGKSTTDKSRHAGEGLFFSSRIADQFFLEANGIVFEYVAANDDWTIKKSDIQTGTQINVVLFIDSDKTTQSVFEKYTDNFSFKFKSPRLVSPYIITLPSGQFPSRSEARKILAGAEKFESIVIDFKNVESIGQGFADEIFRIFQAAHPRLRIEIKNANDLVNRMIQYVIV